MSESKPIGHINPHVLEKVKSGRLVMCPIHPAPFKTEYPGMSVDSVPVYDHLHIEIADLDVRDDAIKALREISEMDVQKIHIHAVKLFAQNAIDKLQSSLAARSSTHPDDVAVDKFAADMKVKLAQARDKGRGGWQECSPASLSKMLREHVDKGDPRDVANFCMFLWSLNAQISDTREIYVSDRQALAEKKDGTC